MEQKIEESPVLHNFSLSYKQLAKDKSFIIDSLKVRGNTEEEIKTRLEQGLKIAQDKLKELNKEVGRNERKSN